MTYRACLRTLAVLLLTALLLVLGTGCSTRETHLAVVQGDQAVQGAQQLLAQPKVAAAVAALPPELSQALAAALEDVDVLLASAHTSLAPAITLTAQGEVIRPETTVEQAVREPKAFAAVAARQAGRAEVEVESLLAWLTGGKALLSFARAAGTDFVAQILAGGGTGGLLLAGGLKILAVVNRLRRENALKDAETEDALAFGNAAEQADTTAEVEDLKREHLKRQAARGTLPGIQAKLARMKTPKPQRLA